MALQSTLSPTAVHRPTINAAAAVTAAIVLAALAAPLPAFALRNAAPAAAQSVVHASATAVPMPRPRPWPIWNWRNHQPNEARLDALHTRDVTADEARRVDRLYRELEGSPPGSERCVIQAGHERDPCPAAAGDSVRVMPSRPVPVIMAPAR
jgi:hypothetical protein